MAAQHMAGGEIVTLEIGPGGIQALEALWAEDVQRDPFTEVSGRRRTLVVDAKRQPLRAVEDEDELVAAGHVDPTHVPLPLWAGAEALAGFSHFRAGTREGVLGGDWWEATLDHLRGTLERCDRAQGFVVTTDAGGYAGVAHSLLMYASEECGRRPRICIQHVSEKAETDLARASKTLDAAVALRELRLESDVVAPWREDMSDIAALAARPLRGRCGAVLDLETWARFVRGPGAGGAGVVVDAAFGPEPAGPFSSVFFDGEEHARDAARRDGLRVVASSGESAEPGLFWTTTDEDADDAATVESEGCARLRAAGPGAADTFRDLAARAGGRAEGGLFTSTAGAARAAAERAGLDADYVDEVHLDLLAVADDVDR